MKRGRTFLVLSVLFLLVSFLPTQWFLPRWLEFTRSHDLGPGEIGIRTINMFYGSSIQLRVSISGANKDVFFYITDSHGEVVFDAGRIYDGYSLDWSSPTIGSLRLNFDNTMSWISHKYVTYSLKVFHYKPLFLLPGIGLLILAIFQIFREEKFIQKIKKLVVKEPETLDIVCEYCGTAYDKALEKCPRCGSPRKKVRVSRKKRAC